ncbi:hypothetical protein GCM10020367_38270 [Streptomyces sannanensis]|uniref:Glycosyltransferase RgtA/B/C/D-like domain-containing protein n=1 Tax=Streptomyces sannanensis TaxID=285536 RepID=A0ABP6SF70_9ACTN
MTSATAQHTVPAQQPLDGPQASAAARRTGRRFRPRDGRAASALLFLLPTAAALACVLTGLGRRQLWRDEHATWWASTLSYADLGALIERIDVVFAPYYALMHLWIMVAGSSPAALRLPEALAMAVSAGLLALIGRKLFNVRAGLLSGLLFAVLPAVTRYGQEARPYSFAMLFTLLATFLLASVLERHTLKGWSLYALAIALTGFSHLVALLVVAAHAGPVLLARRGGDRIAVPAFAGAGVAGVSSLVPMALAGAGQSAQIAWVSATTRYLATYPTALFGSWITGGVMMAAGVVGLLMVGRHAALLVPWAVLPPLLTFLTADRLHLFLPRYLLFTIPAWVLLAAAALTGPVGPFAGPAAARGRRVCSLLLVVPSAVSFTLLALPAIDSVRRDLPYEPDYAGVARIVRESQRPGDGMVFHGGLSERKAMAYELREGARPEDVLMERAPQELGTYGAFECGRPARCLAGTDRVWLISTVAGDPRKGMNGRTAAALDAFEVVRTERLPWVTVQLLSRV